MRFGILPVSGGNQTADAVASALRKRAGTDALVNISIDLVSRYFILGARPAPRSARRRCA